MHGAVLVEQLLRPVRPHPRFELSEVGRVGPHLGEWYLVGAPGTLHRQSVDLLRSGPALGCDKHDHRPPGPSCVPVLAGLPLNPCELVEHLVERRRHQLVHPFGIRSLDEPGCVPVALQKQVQLLSPDPREHGRVGDLVTVQVEHGQHRAVLRRVEELVRVPARRERPGLGLPVADHAHSKQIGVVVDGSVGVQQRVPELASLVDRPRRLGRRVARNPARERELPNQPAQPFLVVADVGIDLGVGAVEVRAGDHAGAAVTGTGHVDRVELAGTYRPVQVRVDEVQAGRRAPMTKQPRLDVLGPQRLAQQRVREQVDLTDCQVIGRAPPRVEHAELFVGERLSCRGGQRGQTYSYPVLECRW